MLIAALLVLYASKTVAIGFSPPMVFEKAADKEPHTDEELTITFVFFFLNSGKRCFVIRKGPTTFVLKTERYSSGVLHLHLQQSWTEACWAYSSQAISGRARNAVMPQSVHYVSTALLTGSCMPALFISRSMPSGCSLAILCAAACKGMANLQSGFHGS